MKLGTWPEIINELSFSLSVCFCPSLSVCLSVSRLAAGSLTGIAALLTNQFALLDNSTFVSS